MSTIKVSIIIPVKEINDYIRESIPIILQLNNQDFEIIILPNEDNIPFTAKKTKIVPSWKVWPAQKRNKWAQIAKWEILAFLDDDAYPVGDWLDKALEIFRNKRVVWVWWPGITPKDDSFWAKVSGAVFLTKIWWWNPERYIPYWLQKDVDDWPSVNLLIRKEDFLEIWWFKGDYWPWEDSKLCEDLVYWLRKRIVYMPDLIVYHHRRPWFIKHLKQVWNYWLHRWFFFRKWDRNSRRFIYLIPSLFFLYISVGFVCALVLKFMIWEWIWSFYLIWLWVYWLALIFGFFDILIKLKDFGIAFFSVFYIICTHISYWIMFLKWLFKDKLVSKLR